MAHVDGGKADMTEAERSSAQADEQQNTSEGGLFDRIVETAKDVVGTITETARDVVETVAERAPAAASSAAEMVSGVATSVVDRVRDRGEQPEGQALTNAVAEGGQATAESRPVAVAEQVDAAPGSDAAAAPVTGAAGEIAESVRRRIARAYDIVAAAGSNAVEAVVPAEVATEVRKRVSRAYDVVASAVPGGETPAAGDQATEGATYQPPAEGGAKSGRPRRFKDVQPGMQLQGKVTSIALYGIFVDVGVGRDGLVHISEMSDKRIESPTELVQIGLQVDVWVKSVDPDARRISLTMRDPNRPKPERTERRGPRRREVNRERLAELKVGDTVEGTISSLAAFGAFVDIGVGKDGLVHVSELAEGRVERPEDAVQVGQQYNFKILEVDPEGNRISLSLRRAQRTQRMQQLEPGTVLDGTISGIAAFGAFVDVGVGRDGLVHVSELSDERVNSVEEVVKVGDKVQVKIIEVDPNSKRISLTMRVNEPLPNERERPVPAPRMAGPGAPRTEGPRFSSPPPAYNTPSPGFGGPPPAFGEGRGEGRGGDRRGGSGRRGDDRGEGGRDTGRFDISRGEGRGGDSRGGARRDRGSDRGGRPGGGRAAGGGRGPRREGADYEPSSEVYSFEDPEDEDAFTGDATLADLVSKFNTGKGNDRRQRDEEEEEGQREDTRADAIRRTLALRDEE